MFRCQWVMHMNVNLGKITIFKISRSRLSELSLCFFCFPFYCVDRGIRGMLEQSMKIFFSHVALNQSFLDVCVCVWVCVVTM